MINNLKSGIDNMVSESQKPSQHEINSQKLKDAGLQHGFERYAVYDYLNNETSKKYDNNGKGEQSIYDDLLIDYDWDVDDEGITNYTINSVTNYKKMMDDYLKGKNIPFDRSKQSNSLYFTIGDTRYRLSDHHRPRGFGYDEEEGIDENIVIKHPRDRYNKLVSLFEKLK